MSTSLSLKLAAATAALLLAGTTAADAANERACEDYAHAAIVQIRGGMNLPRCEREMRGTRWSPEWRVHYDWCRGVSYREMESERIARTETLRACR
jgi:hypothetical protein